MSAKDIAYAIGLGIGVMAALLFAVSAYFTGDAFALLRGLILGVRP